MSALLDELSAHAKQLRSTFDPSIVSIGRDARGTGVVIGPDQVLTTAQNLRDRTTTVTFANGTTVPAEVLASDADGDLVVLRATTANAPVVDLAITAPEPGDVVFALGRGGGRLRVSLGTISATDLTVTGARGREIRGSIEHTAPSAPGSSGGLIVDTTGRVVGITTHRAGRGFYLARPVDAVFVATVQRLSRGESVTRPTLGLALLGAPGAQRLRQAAGLPALDGVLVRAVSAGSPADHAGIRQGDLIVGSGGSAIASVDDLHTVLASVTDELDLKIVRGAEELSLRVSFVVPAAAEQGTA
jgi:S1-C subfamily serine protease